MGSVIKHIVLLWLICFAASSQAQEAVSKSQQELNQYLAASFASAGHPPAFTAYLQNSLEAFIPLLMKQAKIHNQRLGISCSQPVITTVEVVEFGTIEMSKKKLYPTSGEWMYRYILANCNKVMNYNVYFYAKNGGVPAHSPMLPGLTKANMKQALIVAKTAPPYLSKKLKKLCPNQSLDALSASIQFSDSHVTKENYRGSVNNQVF